jgi:hypothetical protein
MKRVRYEYEVYTVVSFTEEERNAIRAVCDAHYDQKVRQLVHDVFWQISSRIEVKLTYRQLDTLCKGMESAVTIAEQAIKRELAAMLREAGAERVRLMPDHE